MDKKAVEQARIEFNRATDSIDALGASNKREEVQTHWSAFLTAARRVFLKLEQGATGTPKSKAWFDTKRVQRRSDPLLCYIWHARNADEHTLIEVTEHRPGVIKEVTLTAEERDNFHRAIRQQKVPPGVLAVPVEITAPHMRLPPVIDRGETYHPPSSPCDLPLNAGMLALSKLDTILREAAALAQ
jgi:hypothetical protein